MVIFKNIMHSNAIFLDYWIFGIPVNFASQESTLFHPLFLLLLCIRINFTSLKPIVAGPLLSTFLQVKKLKRGEDTMLVSNGHWNKLPQTCWPEATHIYSLSVQRSEVQYQFFWTKIKVLAGLRYLGSLSEKKLFFAFLASTAAFFAFFGSVSLLLASKPRA